MAGFFTKETNNYGEYEITFQTKNKADFKMVQALCRLLIDTAKPGVTMGNYIDRDRLICNIVNTPSECCQLPQMIPFLNGSAARQNEIIDLIEAEPVIHIAGGVLNEV